MTMLNTTPVTKAKGNGTTKSFSFLFQALNEDYIRVFIEKDGEFTEITTFTVSLDSMGVGGIVTMQTAPASDEYVIIFRDTDNRHTTVYKTSSGFNANVVEKDFDKITAITQDNKEKISRALKLPIGYDGEEIGVEIPVSGKAVKWDSDGKKLVSSDYDFDEIIEKCLGAQAKAETSAETSKSYAEKSVTYSDLAYQYEEKTKQYKESVEETVKTLEPIIEDIDKIKTVSENMDSIKTDSENIDKIKTVAEHIGEITGGDSSVDISGAYFRLETGSNNVFYLKEYLAVIKMLYNASTEREKNNFDFELVRKIDVFIKTNISKDDYDSVKSFGYMCSGVTYDDDSGEIVATFVSSKETTESDLNLFKGNVILRFWI